MPKNRSSRFFFHGGGRNTQKKINFSFFPPHPQWWGGTNGGMGLPIPQQPSPTTLLLHHLFSLLSLAFQTGGQGPLRSSPLGGGSPPVWKVCHDKGGRTLIPGYSRYFAAPALVTEQYLHTGGTRYNQPHKQQQQNTNNNQQTQTKHNNKQQHKQQQQHTSTTTKTYNTQNAPPSRRSAAEAQRGEGNMEVDLSATSPATIHNNNNNNTDLTTTTTKTNNTNYKQQHNQLQLQQYNKLNTKYIQQQQQQLTARAHKLSPPPPLLVGAEAETLHQLTNKHYNNKRRDKRQAALEAATTQQQQQQQTTHQHATTKATANAPAAATKAAAMDAPPGHALVGPGAYRHAQPGSSPPSTSGILPPPELIPAVNPSLPLPLPPPQSPAPAMSTPTLTHKRKPPSPTNNTNNTPPNKTTKLKRSAQRNKPTHQPTTNNNTTKPTNKHDTQRKLEWDRLAQESDAHLQIVLANLTKNKYHYINTTPTDPDLLKQQLHAQEQHKKQILRGRPSKAEQQPFNGNIGSRLLLPQTAFDALDDDSSGDDSDYG